jgi:iron(II)-dependent oxidoreductase
MQVRNAYCLFGILVILVGLAGCKSTPPKAPSGMLYVEPGTFWMGSDDGRADEAPRRQEKIEQGFFIDQNEVTNEQYKAFLDATQHKPPKGWKDNNFPKGKGNHPVTHVSFFDAQAYAKWAGKRLPTEKEWEYSARGKLGHIYPWGNDFNPKADKDKCNSSKASKGSTTPVGSFEAGKSPFGVYDMAGNVWEWTADWYGQEQKDKIIKGGSFKVFETPPRAAKKGHFSPEKRDGTIGFRCAKNTK